VPSGSAIVIKSLSGTLAGRQAPATADSDGGITVTGFLVSGYSFANDVTPVTKTVDPSSSSTSLPTAIRSTGSSQLTSIPAASAPKSSTAPLASPTSTTSPIPNSGLLAPSQKSSGLSVGAKVGITVGVVFAVVALAIGIACIHIRKRKKREAQDRIEAGVLEISREPRQIKNNQRTHYPDMDGLQAVVSPEALAQRAHETAAAKAGANRETVHGHPGTKVLIHDSQGPHEMEVKSVQKFEMDAGEVRSPTTKSLQLAAERENRQSRTRTRAGSTGTLRQDYANQASPVSRDTSIGRNTPDIIHGHGRNNSITPVSRDTSLGRNTPDLRQPKQVTISRNTSLGDLRNGRTTPGTPDVLHRDARLDVPGGCISPMSTTERSFLDLSDLDD
jgi:hypothetical protein